MKLMVIEGGLSSKEEQPREYYEIVTIIDPRFSTVFIAGELIQRHQNDTATIKHPVGGALISGTCLTPKSHKK